MTENSFIKAQSDNLPKIDAFMMTAYFASNPDFTSAEVRGVKAARSERESYGDSAVGYVQIKRDGNVCVVKARITPEHNVGLSEFWTDDYKVFEQIYGKTSDKDLYSTHLPSITFSDLDKPRGQASDKKERFSVNDALADFDTSYGFGARYANVFPKQLEEEKTTKPTKTLNFISYNDFKPISQFSDPETYNYLKSLEQYNKEQKIKFPKGVGGFQPFVSYVDDNPEEQHAYKSIQDILDAHDANTGPKNVEDDNSPNYYGSGKTRKKANPRKKPGEFTKPRCRSGRCRKRATNTVRVRTRPYLRKVQNRWHSG